MKKLTITNGFGQMSDPTLETRSYQILTAMTDNPNFLTPTPAIADMTTLIGEFFDALSQCKEGDCLKVAIKNQKREALINGLHLWAGYVLFQSAGDSVKAISSGFSIGKTPSPAPPISKPVDFRILNGSNPGELIGKVKREKGVITYLYQYATDEMLALGHWQSIPCSKSTCVIANLQPGTKYNCRVAAIGAKDQLMYSDILSRIVA